MRRSISGSLKLHARGYHLIVDQLPRLTRVKPNCTFGRSLALSLYKATGNLSEKHCKPNASKTADAAVGIIQALQTGRSAQEAYLGYGIGMHQLPAV
jgi:hypothetical protein